MRRRLQASGWIPHRASRIAHRASRIAGAVALVALLAWLAIYLRISAPINKQLRAAAASHTVPADTADLQRRWDGVIWPRAVLQTVAVVGLLTIIVLH